MKNLTWEKTTTIVNILYMWSGLGEALLHSIRESVGAGADTAI